MALAGTLPPPMTDELATRLERATLPFLRAWLGRIAGLERLDVTGAEHLLVGCHPERPDLDFQNRVNGLTPADAHHLHEIATFYERRGVRPWFETVPTDEFGALADAFTDIGAVHVGFHGFLYGRPGPRTDAPETGVAIATVDPTDDEGFAGFRRLRVAGYDLAPAVRAQAAADLRGWANAPAPTFYIATLDDRPAGVAVLSVTGDGVGYLADAATLPSARGQGVQAALIARRVADAADAGCELVCSQATLHHASHRNLQRAGLVPAFTKVVHRVAPPGRPAGPKRSTDHERAHRGGDAAQAGTPY